jgi:twitching motility two-component system response regulator PilH
VDTKRKILVIDDDQAVCDMIAGTLKNRGYEVFTETKYQEGMSKAGEILPDLAFISLLLDTTNGLKVSKELHAIEKLKKVPVIMLISYKGELDPKYTRTIGIVDILVKPASEKDLITKVEAILGPSAVQSAEEIVPEIEDTGSSEAISDFSSSRTDKIVFDPDDQHSNIRDIAGDDRAQLRDRINITADDMGSDVRDVSRPDADPDFLVEEMSAEEDETALMNDEDETEEDGETRRGGEDISFSEFERQETRKKMRMAAVVLAFVAIIGIGTYLGLHFFFSAKDRPIASPVPREGSVKDTPAAQKTETATLPTTGDTRSVEDASNRPAPLVSGQNAGKNESRPRPAPVKERGQQAVTERRPPERTTRVPEVQKKGTYAVQIGYFGELKHAESLATKMRERGYEVTLKEENVGKKISYRVLIGEFNTRNKAMVESVAILRKEGIASVPYKE